MPLFRTNIELIKLINQLSPSQKEQLAIYIEVLNDETTPTIREIELYNLELDQAIQCVRDGKYTSLKELEREMEA